MQSESGESPGDSPATVTVARPLPVLAAREPNEIGTHVARYVVLEDLGRGGMGRVLRAYDPKLQREVALKEVRADILDEKATARLVAEARAMARVSHPNVVAVHDVEQLPSGEVVLVMELIPGQTLRKWIESGKHGWRSIVAVFEAAGRGIHAAHEAGVLHRDFKAANVLMGEHGAIKVTDFGLAKSAGDHVSSGSSAADLDFSDHELTTAGSVMGTPRYMAPEQHVGDVLTSAADQYAFCVALWEALCGQPPFAGKEIVARKHLGPPAWPASGVPGRIVRAVMRGLAPDPDARWPSMRPLLDALAAEPARRQRRWLAVGAAFAILGGTAAWAAFRDPAPAPCSGAETRLHGVWDDAQRVRVRTGILGIGPAYATTVSENVERALDDYASQWTQMYREACEATTIRGEQSAEVMDLQMACLHRASVALRLLGEELADADAAMVPRTHELIADLPPLSRCADTQALRQSVEPPLPDEADAVERIRVLVVAADTALAAGRHAKAKEAIDAAHAEADRVEYGPVRTEVALTQGKVLDALGDFDTAEASLLRALGLASRWRQWESQADATERLVHVVGTQKRKAEEGLHYAVMARALATSDPLREAAVASSVASVLRAQGKYAEAAEEQRRALALREEVLGPETPLVAMSRNSIGLTLASQGRFEDAEAEHRRGLEILERVLGAGHPSVATARNNLANDLAGQGRFAEAETEYRRALAAREAALGPEHPFVVSTRSNIANVLHSMERFAEAEAEHRRVLALREKLLGPEHPEVANSRNNLASALEAQGKVAEAEAEHRQALASRTKALGLDHPDVALSRYNLAVVLRARHRYEEAESELRAALVSWERGLDPGHPFLAAGRYALGELLLDLERADEALPLAEAAWERRERRDTPASDQADAAFLLARVLWSARIGGDDRRRARRLAEQAQQAYGQLAGSDMPAVGTSRSRDVERWLARHPVK